MCSWITSEMADNGLLEIPNEAIPNHDGHIPPFPKINRPALNNAWDNGTKLFLYILMVSILRYAYHSLHGLPLSERREGTHQTIYRGSV